jgi:hypothetical protein
VPSLKRIDKGTSPGKGNKPKRRRRKERRAKEGKGGKGTDSSDMAPAKAWPVLPMPSKNSFAESKMCQKYLLIAKSDP